MCGKILCPADSAFFFFFSYFFWDLYSFAPNRGISNRTLYIAVSVFACSSIFTTGLVHLCIFIQLLMFVRLYSCETAEVVGKQQIRYADWMPTLFCCCCYFCYCCCFYAPLGSTLKMEQQIVPQNATTMLLNVAHCNEANWHRADNIKVGVLMAKGKHCALSCTYDGKIMDWLWQAALTLPLCTALQYTSCLPL